MKKSILFLTIIILQTTVLLATSDIRQIYEKGVIEKENGNYKDALDLWLSAKSVLDDPSEMDPRVGFSFIELVTEQKMSNLYQTASTMYFWALEGEINQENFRHYKTEIERIRPLLNEREYVSFMNKIDSFDNTALSDLRGVWTRLDLTPTSPYNERLIEHWERIAHIRSEYTMNKNTIYETDDRGLIYMRYGKPDRVFKDQFDFDYGQIRYWAESSIKSVGGGAFDAAQVDTNTSLGVAGTDMITDEGMKEYLVTRLTDHAQQYHTYSEFEFWMYYGLTGIDSENVIYIFGRDGNSGQFGLRKSIDEMIPTQAFRTRIQNGPAHSQVTPGFLLQLSLYRQAAVADIFFASSFVNMESEVFSRRTINRQTSIEFRNRSEHQLQTVYARAPDQISDYRMALPDISMELRQFRFIDDENNPYLATFMLSRPHEAIMLSSFNDYNNDQSLILRHVVQLYDENWNVISRHNAQPEIQMIEGGNLRQSPPSFSLFFVPHVKEETRQIFVAELLDANGSKRLAQNSVFSEYLKGSGKMENLQPEPLNTDSETLEMSDLVLGFNRSDNDELFFPYMVALENEIPADENLVIHFEVYHLQITDNGLALFELNYGINPINWLGRARTRTQEVDATVTFETNSDSFREVIEIDTGGLEKGEYELYLTATEPHTRRKIERRVRFTIVD
jgi:GWxTD domain-containing protein